MDRPNAAPDDVVFGIGDNNSGGRRRSKTQRSRRIFVLAFLDASDGTFWIATDEGVSHINGDRVQNLRTEDGLAYSDAALIKNWHARERYNLQFRFELFNAFNHPSFGNPNTSLFAGNVGAITSVASIPPRVGQAALKLTF